MTVDYTPALLACWREDYWRKPTDDPNNTTDTLDQADEHILTYTVSDEALEAAGGVPAIRMPLTYEYGETACLSMTWGCQPG